MQAVGNKERGSRSNTSAPARRGDAPCADGSRRVAMLGPARHVVRSESTRGPSRADRDGRCACEEGPVSAPKRIEGPRFEVRTWQEAVPGRAAPMWFARMVRLRPDEAPFTTKRQGTPAEKLLAAILRCPHSTAPGTPRTTMVGAIVAVIEEWQKAHGDIDQAAWEDGAKLLERLVRHRAPQKPLPPPGLGGSRRRRRRWRAAPPPGPRGTPRLPPGRTPRRSSPRRG